jgi:hypothetical protein
MFRRSNISVDVNCFVNGNVSIRLLMSYVAIVLLSTSYATPYEFIMI